MKFIMTTFALLCLIALVSFKAQSQYVSTRLLQKAYYDTRQGIKKDQFDTTNLNYNQLEKLNESKPNKEKTEKKNKDSLKKKDKKNYLRLDLLPLHDRLNLARISIEDFKKSKGEQADPFTYYHIAARLLKKLYGDFDFFQQIPNVEYTILDSLFYAAHSKKYPGQLKDNFKGPINSPHHLTAIPFNNPKIREIFCKILEGGREGHRSYPSLFDFATFNSKAGSTTKISIHSIKEELLACCINSEEIAHEIILLRNAMHGNKLLETKKGKIYTSSFLTKDIVNNLIKVAPFENKISFSCQSF